MKLQNNFTTPEQSKRLLAAGFPEDTADCYYFASGEFLQIDTPDVLAPWKKFSDIDVVDSRYFKKAPCWSVGRLFEILLILQKLVYEKWANEIPESETNWLTIGEYITIRADRYNVENIVAWIEEINRAEVDINYLLGGIEYE